MRDLPEKDKLDFKRWDKAGLPQKILIIRFHAIGDIAAALPACQGFRNLLPNARIDLLTSEESFEMIKAAHIFDNVYTVPFFREEIESLGNIGKFLLKVKLKITAFRTALKLKKNSYDIVIDLQHNRNSSIVLNVVKPGYWSRFDRYSPKPHSARVLETFHRAGFDELKAEFNINITGELKSNAEEILTENGWDKKKKLIVLNPAGLWITRNWPVENYNKLAKLILKENDAMFLIMGDERINDKAKILKDALGKDLIDLSGKTALQQAFAILRSCSLIISEDSALAHMAWALGIPVVLMFGSTRSDWACHSQGRLICLSSSDLECGNCMQPVCKYGDVHCLTRYAAEFVYERAVSLL